MIRTVTKKPSRLLSLDVMRGLNLAVMILVNNAREGSVSYAQLRHSVSARLERGARKSAIAL